MSETTTTVKGNEPIFNEEDAKEATTNAKDPVRESIPNTRAAEEGSSSAWKAEEGLPNAETHAEDDMRIPKGKDTPKNRGTQ